MEELPLDLQHLILYYKEQLDLTEKFDKVMKELYDGKLMNDIKMNADYQYLDILFEELCIVFNYWDWNSDNGLDNKGIFQIFKAKNMSWEDGENIIMFNYPVCFRDKCEYFGNYDHRILCTGDITTAMFDSNIKDLVEMKLHIDPDHHFYEGYRISGEYIVKDGIEFSIIDIDFGS